MRQIWEGALGFCVANYPAPRPGSAASHKIGLNRSARVLRLTRARGARNLFKQSCRLGGRIPTGDSQDLTRYLSLSARRDLLLRDFDLRPSRRMSHRLDRLRPAHDEGRLRVHHQALVVDEFPRVAGITGPEAFLEGSYAIVIHRVLLAASRVREDRENATVPAPVYQRPPTVECMLRSTAASALASALASVGCGRSERSTSLPFLRMAHWYWPPGLVMGEISIV